MNFRKMDRGNLQCIFQCNVPETQSHIFENCQPILSKLSVPHNVRLEDKYGDIHQQRNCIKILTQIDKIRKSVKESILPGGVGARTLAYT